MTQLEGNMEKQAVGRGHGVAQLVEAPRYKPEGRMFEGLTGIFH
jgi:hypothetical protein